ncbi:MAG: WYL domain-containing protein [Bosea sp.]|nr:WYL domain-containing protein [Bosea sp. (in: a-proteobacteria)]
MNKARQLKVRRTQAADPILIAALTQLPPAMMETVWLGALLTARLVDDAHAKAARAIIAALEHIRASTIDSDVVVITPDDGNKSGQKTLAHRLDIHALREALIHEWKLGIAYTDAKGRATQRTVWPLDVEDYGPNGAMLAFCEKRQDFRNFRFDRITELAIVQQKLNAPRRVMLAFYTALSGDDEF